MGKLRLVLDSEGEPASTHWVQPPLKSNGTVYASPVRLQQTERNRWRGDIEPREDTFTLYLVIQSNDDGTLTGFIRNPDRNVGLFLQPSRIVVEGEEVRIFGRFRGRGDEALFLKGDYIEAEERLSIYAPFVGASFDFRRADEDSHFYSRALDPEAWSYLPPAQIDDGWHVTTLCDADIDPEPIRQMIEQEVDQVADSVHAHDLHGVLVARHGKLVLEEYFHGFHRNLPHDTRSASKSLTATLYGAALEAGLVDTLEAKVFESLGATPDDPRKETMSALHLLTQSSGFYCDDSDYEAPGNEENMQEQTKQPDWYRYTLDVPMKSAPGKHAVYCSANSNLIGALLSANSGQPLEHLFETLIAEPLQLGRYYLNLQPTGEPYMGGGIHWLPRDFLKLGQLHLDGGTWNGNRIVSKPWARDATTTQTQIGDRGYGYQWWVQKLPYGDREVEVFYAGGNGGQVIAVVRELDLVVGFFGGNYSDPVLYKSQNVLLPNYILEAVRSGQQRECPVIAVPGT
jgi:CubicO group peptidase (beta-lactamase class C family)